MVETLSRFLALENVPEDVKIVLPRRTQPYMLRSLELFGGVSPDRYVYCDGEDWELEECWFPTKPYGWFLPSRREVVEVSRRILGNFRGSSRGLGAERLYVSRGRCASRRLVNEEEISRFLESRGFVTWYPEEDSLDQQITTCQDARVIVSSFGSEAHRPRLTYSRSAPRPLDDPLKFPRMRRETSTTSRLEGRNQPSGLGWKPALFEFPVLPITVHVPIGGTPPKSSSDRSGVGLRSSWQHDLDVLGNRKRDSVSTIQW